MMTKKERIQAAIAGEKPDKLPYSFWTHRSESGTFSGKDI